MTTNSPVRIQTFMRRGVIATLAAAGTFGAAALAWSAPAITTGHPQPAATAQVTPAPSPGQNYDYCKQDPYWYLCQHYHEKPAVASPD